MASRTNSLTLLDLNVTIPSSKSSHASNYPTITAAAQKKKKVCWVILQLKSLKKQRQWKEIVWECVPVSAEYMWIMCLFVLICAKSNPIYNRKHYMYSFHPPVSYEILTEVVTQCQFLALTYDLLGGLDTHIDKRRWCEK